MPKTSPRASAHKFLVIESLATCTKYTGTKEQLIAAGFAKPDHFPEGKKRLKYHFTPGVIRHPDEFQMKKIKGGRFELKKYNENRGPARTAAPSLEVSMEKNDAGYFNWKLYSDIEELQNGSSYSSLAEAARLIVDALKHEQYQARIKRLTLVSRSTASGGER